LMAKNSKNGGARIVGKLMLKKSVKSHNKWPFNWDTKTTHPQHTLTHTRGSSDSCEFFLLNKLFKKINKFMIWCHFLARARREIFFIAVLK
jgi:hypothetical protein